MTLQQLKYAIEIAKTGQFSKAAEQLYVSQPSLTKAINELEKEIGVPLFLRSRKGVTVTDAGVEFLVHARQIMAQYILLTETFGHSGNVKKRFGVSCQHYSFAVEAFMDTLRQYDSAKYEFALRETKTADIIRDVSTLRSEIGILFVSEFNEKYLERIFWEHQLVFHELLRCAPYVFLCKEHPLAKKKTLTFHDLAPYPCLTFEQDETSPYFYAEELLPLNEYQRIVKTQDKLTMLNLLVGIDGYTLCTGMIYDKLNEKEFISVPFLHDELHPADTIRIGYIVKKDSVRTETGQHYLAHLQRRLQSNA